VKLGKLGVRFGDWLQGINGNDKSYGLLLAALLLTSFTLNSNQIVARIKPDRKSLLFLLVISLWSVLELHHASEFIYFQF
jgi:hypothetical protein